MSKATDDLWNELGYRKVASGTWYYDRTVPMPVAIWAKPAHLSSSRFDEDEQLIESSPIPATKDGNLYVCWPGNCGEHLTPTRPRQRQAVNLGVQFDGMRIQAETLLNEVLHAANRVFAHSEILLAFQHFRS
jgi:hypothetical protein